MEVIQLLSKIIRSRGDGTGYEFSYQSSRSFAKYIEFEKDWHGLVDDYFRAAMSSPLLSASSVVIRKRYLIILACLRLVLSEAKI